MTIRRSIGRVLLLLAAPAVLTACEAKGTLDNSQVELMTVDGRKYEVRLAPAGGVDEYRLMVVRATLVLGANPEAERERATNVARQVMDRTCKGRRRQVLEDNLVDDVNYYTRFRCLA